jgi:hypothetical protein
VFESIERECFPFPRGWVMGHCSVGDAGRDIIHANSELQTVYIRSKKKRKNNYKIA